MLDQVIYTECNPQRDLLHKGKLVHKSGYGVFSLSKRLAEEDIKTLKGLYELFNYTNCSKEKDKNIGIFGSYIYTRTRGGLWAYIYDYGRPHCKNPLKERLHRSGIHIKQCLVGLPEGRPCDWFSSSVWTAWLEHEDNYYFEDAMGYEPPFLNDIPSSLPDGERGIDESISDFVYDGRQRALAGAVSFILSQLRLPDLRQKVLLIRDTPENVNKWIIAISCCLPVNIARFVTFNTNISGLNNKVEAKLFSYEDANAQRKVIKDTEGVKKTPFFLIAGVHPRDGSCSGIRQFSSSPFVLLDGEKKQLAVEQDISHPFYRAVQLFSPALFDICNNIITKVPEDITKVNLEELYDVCTRLTGGRMKTSINGLLEDLRAVMEYGTPGRDLSESILRSLLSVYDNFSETDRKSNYPVLEIMSKMAGLCGRENDVTRCIAEGLKKTISNTRDGAVFSGNWRSIQEFVSPEIVSPILSEIFTDQGLRYFYNKFPQSDPLTVAALIDMYLTLLKNRGNVSDTILTDRMSLSFIYYGLLSLSFHEEVLKTVLSELKVYDNVMEYLVFNIGSELMKNNPEVAYTWFDTIADECGIGLTEMITGICGISGVSIDRVEGYLQSRVKKTKKIDSLIVAALNNAVSILGAQEITGMRLFEEGIRCVDINELTSVIVQIRQCNLSDKANEMIFDGIDRKLLLRCSDNSIDDKVYDCMVSWGRKLRKQAGCAEMREFIVSYDRVIDRERALSLIESCHNKKITLPPGFLRSPCWQAVIDKTSLFYDGEILFSILTMAQTDRTEEMVTSLVTGALEKSNAAGYIEKQLLAVCCAGVVPYQISGMSASALSRLRSKIMEVLSAQTEIYYRPNMEVRIQKSKEFDKQVRDALIGIIRESIGGSKKTGGFGMLRNIFNKDK